LFYKIPAAKLLKHHGGISKGFLKKFEPVYEFSEMFENIKGKS